MLDGIDIDKKKLFDCYKIFNNMVLFGNSPESSIVAMLQIGHFNKELIYFMLCGIDRYNKEYIKEELKNEKESKEEKAFKNK